MIFTSAMMHHIMAENPSGNHPTRCWHPQYWSRQNTRAAFAKNCYQADQKTLFIEAPFLVCGVMRGRRGLTVWREGGVQGGANGIARYWLSHLGLLLPGELVDATWFAN